MLQEKKDLVFFLNGFLRFYLHLNSLSVNFKPLEMCCQQISARIPEYFHYVLLYAVLHLFDTLLVTFYIKNTFVCKENESTLMNYNSKMLLHVFISDNKI